MSAPPSLINSRLHGDATLAHVETLRDLLAQHTGAELDVSGLNTLDTAGAWALLSAPNRPSIVSASASHAAILQTVGAVLPAPAPQSPPQKGWRNRIEGLGRSIVQTVALIADLIAYLGLTFAALATALRHPGRFRLTALVAHAQDVGLRAVPIVALMAFLIGVVLAFQGAAQLRQFGAEVFVVDLIAVSIMRELGILLTAIIVAGRTASAYTAAIGSMKMREEVDAMQTLGIDPAQALILPRVLALVLMLPILGLVADLLGLIGGALMSWIVLDISPAMFLTRLGENTALSHVIVGLVKAPVFAMIIGVVGCRYGMQVRGTAESLGQNTSRAVVTAIFAVIVADALFSIFFAEMGL